MIYGYQYCGISNDKKRIWGVAIWHDDDTYVQGQYLFWGSSKNPIIKKAVPMPRTRKDSLFNRINDKRKSYSGYTEIEQDRIEETFPDLDSQIEMFILARKLKHG